MEPRYSVVINVNPASVYPKENFKTLDEQLLFATKYICGFLDFKAFLGECVSIKVIVSNILVVEIFFKERFIF